MSVSEFAGVEGFYGVAGTLGEDTLIDFMVVLERWLLSEGALLYFRADLYRIIVFFV